MNTGAVFDDFFIGMHYQFINWVNFVMQSNLHMTPMLCSPDTMKHSLTFVVEMQVGVVKLLCINKDHICMHPASERRRYNVTSSLIGWAPAKNDPCISCMDFSLHLLI